MPEPPTSKARSMAPTTPPHAPPDYLLRNRSLPVKGPPHPRLGLWSQPIGKRRPVPQPTTPPPKGPPPGSQLPATDDIVVEEVEAVEHGGEGAGVGDVSFENLVREGEAIFIESHANGDLAAVVSLLFVLAVLRFGIGGAEALEVGVGDIVEDDAALKGEEGLLVIAEFLLDLRQLCMMEFLSGRQDRVAEWWRNLSSRYSKSRMPHAL